MHPFRLIISIALLMLCNSAFAVGLGNINVHSSLNEPLRASVPIIVDASEGPINSYDLTIGLASHQAHRDAGLEYPGILDDFRFNVATREDGSLVLNIYSTRSIYEPLLIFLIDLKSPNGQLIKEYSMILDPISYTPALTDAPVYTPPTEVTRPTRNRRSAVVSRPVRLEGADYSVQTGDSLSKIAMAVRARDGGDLEQIMQSIYNDNPEAFQNSPDLLLAGARLRLPTESTSTLPPVDTTTAINPTTETNNALAPTPPTDPPAQSERPRLVLIPPEEIVDQADATAGSENLAGAQTAENELVTEALNLLNEEQRRTEELSNRNTTLERKLTTLEETNAQMQIQLQQINQLLQQQRDNTGVNWWRHVGWLVSGLLALALLVVMLRHNQQRALRQAQAASAAVNPPRQRRVVPDLVEYGAADPDTEAPIIDPSPTEQTQIVDDLATSQELYESTSLIDSDDEATQTFVGNLSDIELDAGQNLDAAQEAEIYLAYGQYKLADRTIAELLDNDPDNYKFQILKLQLLAKTGKMEEMQELSVSLLRRFPNRDDEVHRRIQEICDTAFSANLANADAKPEAKPEAEKDITDTLAVGSLADDVPEYEDTKEIDPTEPSMAMTAIQDDITEFLNEDLTLSDTDPMLMSSLLEDEVETEVNSDIEYNDLTEEVTELMDDITEEGLDLPFDLETEILQEEEKREIIKKHLQDAEDDEDGKDR